MKCSFEVKGIKWSFTGDVPEQVLDVVKDVCEIVKENIPAIKQIVAEAINSK